MERFPLFRGLDRTSHGQSARNGEAPVSDSRSVGPDKSPIVLPNGHMLVPAGNNIARGRVYWGDHHLGRAVPRSAGLAVAGFGNGGQLEIYANADRRDTPAAAFRARGDHAGLPCAAGRLFHSEPYANLPVATPWGIDIHGSWIAHGRVTSVSHSFKSAGPSASAAALSTQLQFIARTPS